MKKTKARIVNFFTFRAQVQEWYGNRDPFRPELMEILNLGYLFVARDLYWDSLMIIF